MLAFQWPVINTYRVTSLYSIEFLHSCFALSLTLLPFTIFLQFFMGKSTVLGDYKARNSTPGASAGESTTITCQGFPLRLPKGLRQEDTRQHSPAEDVFPPPTAPELTTAEWYSSHYLSNIISLTLL